MFIILIVYVFFYRVHFYNEPYPSYIETFPAKRLENGSIQVTVGSGNNFTRYDMSYRYDENSLYVTFYTVPFLNVFKSMGAMAFYEIPCTIEGNVNVYTYDNDWNVVLIGENV